MCPVTEQSLGGGRWKLFIPHKSQLEPRVLKICCVLLFRFESEEEYEAQNGLDRYQFLNSTPDNCHKSI